MATVTPTDTTPTTTPPGTATSSPMILKALQKTQKTLQIATLSSTAATALLLASAYYAQQIPTIHGSLQYTLTKQSPTLFSCSAQINLPLKDLPLLTMAGVGASTTILLWEAKKRVDSVTKWAQSNDLGKAIIRGTVIMTGLATLAGISLYGGMKAKEGITQALSPS